MNQAAKRIDQVLEKNPDAYFMHYEKAQIEAKLGNKKEAIALGAKGNRYPEERQSAGRIRDQKRAADYRQFEVRISSPVGRLGTHQR
jgi:hypothetical protein